ncbi:MAG: DUF4878 domain-containing protein [Ferruginibacter sp.]
MKKFLLLAITGFVIALSGCQTGGGGNPTDVLTNFFNALAKKDVTTAKKYATKDSDGMLSMMESGMKMSGNMQSDHEDKMVEMLQNAEMGTPVIKGDEATITVTDKKSGESADFMLKKESGDWKVAFDMTTLSEMAREKMKEKGMDMPNMNMDSLNANMPDLKQKMDSIRKLMDSTRAND